MKRRSIPDPIIVDLADGGEALRPAQVPFLSTADLRQRKVEEFIASRSLQLKSEQAYRRDLQSFMVWTPQEWDTVTHRQVVQFKQYLLQERKLAANSVNRILRTLKIFYRWMLESENLPSDPTKAVKQEKVPEAQSQNLEDQEVEQIYRAISEVSRDPKRDRALFSLLLHGLRAQEVVALNIEDYDGQQGVIRAVKHDSVAEVPLTQPARADVDAYVLQRQALTPQLAPHSPLFVSNSNRSKGQRLTYWGVQEVMKLLIKSTGIELQAHRGRHTFCTTLSNKPEMDSALARSRP